MNSYVSFLMKNSSIPSAKAVETVVKIVVHNLRLDILYLEVARLLLVAVTGCFSLRCSVSVYMQLGLVVS
jgi:hypothetical protein